jgi:hypothetical protein
MKRLRIRGKIDFGADPPTVRLMLSQAPATGGRARYVEDNTGELSVFLEGEEVSGWLDIAMPENETPTP